MNNDFIMFDCICREDAGTPAKNANSRDSMLPVFIYNIIREKTTRFRKMTQVKLLSELERFPYEIDVTRQTLSRALQTLANEHIGIHVSREGVWYEHISAPSFT